MTVVELTQEQFFEKYNIDSAKFQEANISWISVLQIYEDFSTYREKLESTADYIANTLRKHHAAHTVRSRVKEPEHLIDKIIRKIIREKAKVNNNDYNITIDNYKSEITDLIGIRVLHLYKDQAVDIDKYIRELWTLKEKCTINYREGDYTKPEDHEDNELFKFNVHEAGYRSWHYLVSSQATKHEHIAEIQVRTIFEEGWSEIDHQLRYPNNINNDHLTKQLLVLNRVAGSADEMATAIRETQVNTRKLEAENNKNRSLIEELKLQLDAVLEENKVEKSDREKLEAKVKELEESLTITIPSRGSLGNNDGLFGKVQVLSVTSPSTLIGTGFEDSYTGNLVINQEQEDSVIFDTKKYLNGYTHPAINREVK